jgi:hypothetical protein
MGMWGDPARILAYQKFVDLEEKVSTSQPTWSRSKHPSNSVQCLSKK